MCTKHTDWSLSQGTFHIKYFRVWGLPSGAHCCLLMPANSSFTLASCPRICRRSHVYGSLCIMHIFTYARLLAECHPSFYLQRRRRQHGLISARDVLSPDWSTFTRNIVQRAHPRSARKDGTSLGAAAADQECTGYCYQQLHSLV